MEGREAAHRETGDKAVPRLHKSKVRLQKKDESLLDTDFQIQTYIAHTADNGGAPAEEDRK